MKKNNKSTKQRRAQANRGKKNFAKGKAVADNKHIRAEKKRKAMAEKQRRLEALIQRLSNSQETMEQPTVNATPEAYSNDALFKAP